jgi:hypothetical protein
LATHLIELLAAELIIKYLPSLGEALVAQSALDA